MLGEVNHQGTEAVQEKFIHQTRMGLRPFISNTPVYWEFLPPILFHFTEKIIYLVSFEAKNHFRILVKLYCKRHCNFKFLVPDIFKMAVFDARKFCQNLLRVHRPNFGEPIRNS